MFFSFPKFVLKNNIALIFKNALKNLDFERKIDLYGNKIYKSIIQKIEIKSQ